MEGNPLFEQLSRRLEQLSQRQQQFANEIASLQKQIAHLSSQSADEQQPVIEITPTHEFHDEPLPVMKEIPLVTLPSVHQETNEPVSAPPRKKIKTPIEEFIGTNLLNKIGIAVLVIGVGIGVQYAIDHGMINEVTRVVLGYLCGVALIGVALRLKKNYAPFSAVLLSGGMAVLYFVTFVAYSVYGKIPREVAFVLMLLFTAFTVFAALEYAMQVIAIIGLVGAYGVPFLLSTGSGNYAVLFAYMTIVNVGILFLGFKQSWRILNYTAFALTWIIYSFWYIDRYDSSFHLKLAMGFSTVFFAIFYVTILAFKILREENLTKTDISLVLLNSFLYYGFGYAAISGLANGALYLGVFTIFNALLHFLACFIIFKSKAQSKGTFLFAAGLVLVFLTLAVPVQLEGNWVTIIWAAEALLMFWLGRTKNYPGYEKLSYPLILLAVGSLIQDWSSFYSHNGYTVIVTFFNIQFLTSLIVCAALGGIVKLSYTARYQGPLKQGNPAHALLMVGLPVILTIVLYAAFLLEINSYWDQRFVHSQLFTHSYGETNYVQDYDVLKFNTIWRLSYTAVFILALGAFNYFRIKNKTVSHVIVALGSLVVFLLVTAGLNEAAGLRESYLTQNNATYYYRDLGHLLIRYVCIGLALMVMFMNYRTVKLMDFEDAVKKAERLFFHFIILSVLSSELINVLSLLAITDSDKLALSILWGAYALGLIVYGLAKDQKYIRIGAFVVFGITLIKLFFYDMAGMGTISKTLVMIILGVLLLVASFLYNKFKKKSDENDENV